MTSDTDKDGQCWRQEELRIVLLGWDRLEKSMVGNAMLGHEAFDTGSDTDVCMRKQGVSAAGTQLTVVNTPQDWLHYVVHDPASVDHRLVTSASMCQPGPHVFLLVISVDSLSGRERSLQAAILLLSDILWPYIIVVLTGLEKLTESSMIKDIAEEYQCLQSVLEKCGHRHHYLNTTQQPQDSDPQAMDLLKSMLAMAAGNQEQTGEAFLCPDSILKEAERRIIVDNKKAKVRSLGQKECQTHKLLQAGISSRRTSLRVVMVGARQAGKSTVGNVILGHKVFQSGHPTSCCVAREGDAVGRSITLVDTPGWEHKSSSSVDTPEKVRLQRVQSTIMDETEPNAFLVVIRSDEMFTENDKHLLQEHLTPWGRDVWRRGIVLFTRGDQLGETTVENHIERWPALVWLVEKCSNRYHVLDNVVRTCNCKVKELIEKIEAVDLINDNQILLQALLKAERDKSKQRFKVKELQKNVRDLQRDYEQQERLQEERNQRLQETLQSCEGLQLDRQREVRILSLSEAEGKPEKGQTGIRSDSTDRSETMHLTEPTFLHMDSAVVQKVEQPIQEATKQHPQQLEIKPVGTTRRYEGAAIGAVIGTLAGLRRGILRAAMGTAIGVSVGALLDAYLGANGKH
ncbi:GTPase IMAP family member 8-like isoform X3 [Alosa sapidissima]|uniref:GTPase IMAP family member 8-like isoform X3 n=1 Tax=Alosa sapidissima TaxID=34773 RepID=UPI001C09A36E|nr:GTPase IMAP family member 8-like isoform X3 [Alosa sapidissima]